jgi:hypothetical protein
MFEGVESRRIFFSQPLKMRNGELENLLCTDIVVRFADLPKRWQVDGFEEYTNWLSRLTMDDPRHFERGAHVDRVTHIQAGLSYRYPRKPVIGGLDTVRIVMPQETDRYYPMVTIHSHPSPLPFSTQDFSPIILDPDWRFSTEVEMVGTTHKNFMLLATSDTAAFSDPEIDQIVEEAAQLRYTREDVLRSRYSADITSYFKKLGRGSRMNFYRLLKAAEVEMFGGARFPIYLAAIENNLALADRHRVGFYVSDKDGDYQRVDQEYVGGLRTELEQRVGIPGFLESLFEYV